jgi:hypothetical protein
MKFRIVGTIVMIAILAALFILTESQKQNDQQQVPQNASQNTDPDANALKGLKIN